MTTLNLIPIGSPAIVQDGTNYKLPVTISQIEISAKNNVRYLCVWMKEGRRFSEWFHDFEVTARGNISEAGKNETLSVCLDNLHASSSELDYRDDVNVDIKILSKLVNTLNLMAEKHKVIRSVFSPKMFDSPPIKYPLIEIVGDEPHLLSALDLINCTILAFGSRCRICMDDSGSHPIFSIVYVGDRPLLAANDPQAVRSVDPEKMPRRPD